MPACLPACCFQFEPCALVVYHKRLCTSYRFLHHNNNNNNNNNNVRDKNSPPHPARTRVSLLTHLVAVFVKKSDVVSACEDEYGHSCYFVGSQNISSFTSRARIIIMFTKFAVGSSGRFKSPVPIPL